MGTTRIIVSAQKADEIIAGLNHLKLFRTSCTEIEEGDVIKISANLPNGHYHPIAKYEYLVTEIEPVDDLYINAYFIEK